MPELINQNTNSKSQPDCKNLVESQDKEIQELQTKLKSLLAEKDMEFAQLVKNLEQKEFQINELKEAMDSHLGRQEEAERADILQKTRLEQAERQVTIKDEENRLLNAKLC